MDGLGVDAEISDLDGEMQNLVYDNYTKFISATDTIRQMKRNVENMEQEMQSLIKSMEVINRKSDKVTHNLGSRRSAVETLSRREAVLMQVLILSLSSLLSTFPMMESRGRGRLLSISLSLTLGGNFGPHSSRISSSFPAT